VANYRKKPKKNRESAAKREESKEISPQDKKEVGLGTANGRQTEERMRLSEGKNSLCTKYFIGKKGVGKSSGGKATG